MNLTWSRKELTPQKLGTFCEYYAKMALLSYGISVYSSVVDDHGIDFVAEIGGRFLKIQVKAVRQGTGYVFVRKEYFDIQDSGLYMLLIRLTDGEYPELYLIPTAAWGNVEDKMFIYHAYEGKKSTPEYGINLSARNQYRLEQYRLEIAVQKLMVE